MNDVGVAVVFRDEAKWGIGILIHRGVEAFVHPGHQPVQVGAHAGKQFPVRLCALPVPVLQADILCLVVDVNLAFHNHQVIRTHAQAGARQGFQQTGKVAAGIDDPLGAGLLQSAQQKLQFARHRRVLKLGEKRSVEISRNDLDGQ